MRGSSTEGSPPATALRRTLLTRTSLAGLLAASLVVSACADLEGAGPPPRQSGLGSLSGSMGSSPSSAGMSAGAGAGSAPSAASRAPRADEAAPGDGPSVSTRPAGKPDWVAVFESPREANYSDQQVIYVDRANLQVQKLDQYTYYLARTREVRRTNSTPKIRELAVLCEGTPSAPATSLRGEGTEDRNGNYSIQQAAAPLTSVDQFSTQKVRIDPNNPNTFVIRAICLLGIERSG